MSVKEELKKIPPEKRPLAQLIVAALAAQPRECEKGGREMTKAELIDSVLEEIEDRRIAQSHRVQELQKRYLYPKNILDFVPADLFIQKAFPTLSSAMNGVGYYPYRIEKDYLAAIISDPESSIFRVSEDCLHAGVTRQLVSVFKILRDYKVRLSFKTLSRIYEGTLLQSYIANLCEYAEENWSLKDKKRFEREELVVDKLRARANDE